MKNNLKKLIKKIGIVRFCLRVISVPFFISALFFKIISQLICILAEFISEPNPNKNNIKRYWKDLKKMCAI